MLGPQDAVAGSTAERSTIHPANLQLVDMHCHLDRMANAGEVARAAEQLGLGIFCTPVTPADTLHARAVLAHAPNVRVGVGLHPWWIADGRCGEADARAAAQLAADARFIGEVGLDFSRTRIPSREAQVAALDGILHACAEHPMPDRVLSIHAVRSADTVLDLLERYDLTSQATCIFHWFTGTGDELTRARRLGCRFSVNERMLATRKGRAYARAIEERLLLLETDAPPLLDAPYSAEAIAAELTRTLDTLALLRATDRNDLAAHRAETSRKLLSL